MKDLRNTLINLASFGITSLLGLYLYFLLVKNGNESTLGVFNFQYIFIVIISQLSTFGVHYSVLKESSNKEYSKNLQFNNFLSGVLIVFLISLLLGLLLFLLKDFISTYLNFKIDKIIIPAIFFSINKCCYWFLNGKEKFAKMAFLSPIRFLTFLLTYLSILENNSLQELLYLCFLYGEILVFFLALFFLYPEIKMSFDIKSFLNFITIHYAFSKKAFLTSFLSDLNLKIDILLIGILLGTQSVGYYTFTSAIGEGLIGLITATRTMSTPKYAILINEKAKFNSFKKSIFKITSSLFLPIGLFILIFTHIFSNYFSFLIQISDNGMFSLIVIVIGFSLISYCFAFEHILLQINYPKEHTKSLLLLFISNLSLNLVLINLYGINGAAVATIMSYIIYFFQINKKLRKFTKLSFLI